MPEKLDKSEKLEKWRGFKDMIKKLETEEKQDAFEKEIASITDFNIKAEATEPVVKMDPTAVAEQKMQQEAAYKAAVGKLVGEEEQQRTKNVPSAEDFGGSTAYYKLFKNTFTDLQDVIESVNMNFAMGNIFKAVYRFYTKNQTNHDRIRDLNKIIYFAERERDRRLNG